MFLVDYKGEEVNQFFQIDKQESKDKRAVAYLTDYAFLYYITREDMYGMETTAPAVQFLIKDCYNKGRF